MQTSKVEILSDLTSTQLSLIPGLTWGQLSGRLHEITGVELLDMKLIIDKDRGVPIFPKEVMQKKIGNISTIEVIDTNENSMASQIKRDLESQREEQLFKYSEKDYENRSDSVLKWKKDNKLGRFDPIFQEKMQAQSRLNNAKVNSLFDKVGERCSVTSAEDGPTLERRGWLRFVGKVLETNTDEIWCGVEFDEPVGKNDGSLGGTVYFGPVNQNYGGFVKPVNVEIGPQFQPFIDDDLLLSDDEI